MAIQEIKVGQVISNEPIPQLKFKENIPAVINFIDPEHIFAVTSYFLDQRKDANNKNILGYIHATDDMIPTLGSPGLHYYGLAISYPVNGFDIAQGYGMDEKQVKFGFVKFGPANYDKLRQAKGPHPDLSKIDISVGVNLGKEKFQDLNLVAVTTNPAKWQQMPTVIQKIETYKQMFRTLLPDLIGLEISLEDVIAYLHGTKTALDIQNEIKAQKMNTSFVANNHNAPAALAQPMVRTLGISPTQTEVRPMEQVMPESKVDLVNLTEIIDIQI